MNETFPDTWVVVKIYSPGSETIYKILAGWYGGYLNGDSWKINSGITKVVDAGDSWKVYGYSGSIYQCPKNSEKLSGITSGILEYYSNMMKQLDNGSSIEVVDASECFKQFLGL